MSSEKVISNFKYVKIYIYIFCFLFLVLRYPGNKLVGIIDKIGAVPQMTKEGMRQVVMNCAFHREGDYPRLPLEAVANLDLN